MTRIFYFLLTTSRWWLCAGQNDNCVGGCCACHWETEKERAAVVAIKRTLHLHHLLSSLVCFEVQWLAQTVPSVLPVSSSSFGSCYKLMQTKFSVFSLFSAPQATYTSHFLKTMMPAIRQRLQIILIPSRRWYRFKAAVMEALNADN